MLVLVIDFANLLLVALVTGVMFGVSLLLNPAGLDANSYATLQKQAIRKLNHVMPPMGAAAIVLTIAAGFLSRHEPQRFWLLLAAAACLLASGLITRFLNQPINAIVMAWPAGSPPADWRQLRDEWWRWHLVRSGVGLAALSLIIAAALRRGWAA